MEFTVLQYCLQPGLIKSDIILWINLKLCYVTISFNFIKTRLNWLINIKYVLVCFISDVVGFYLSVIIVINFKACYNKGMLKFNYFI